MDKIDPEVERFKEQLKGFFGSGGYEVFIENIWKEGPNMAATVCVRRKRR